MLNFWTIEYPFAIQFVTHTTVVSTYFVTDYLIVSYTLTILIHYHSRIIIRSSCFNVSIHPIWTRWFWVQVWVQGQAARASRVLRRPNGSQSGWLLENLVEESSWRNEPLFHAPSTTGFGPTWSYALPWLVWMHFRCTVSNPLEIGNTGTACYS